MQVQHSPRGQHLAHDALAVHRSNVQLHRRCLGAVHIVAVVDGQAVKACSPHRRRQAG